MRKYKILILLIVIPFGILTLSLIPILIKDKTLSDNLVSYATYVGGLCSIVAIILAIVIYPKLVIDDTILSRKTEMVFKFIEELTSTHLTVETGKGAVLFVSFNRLKDLIEYEEFKHYFELEFVIERKTYFEIHEKIISKVNGLFMPKEIRDKLLVFDISAFHVPTEPLTDYAKIRYTYQKDIADYIKPINGQGVKMKLGDFLEQWIRVIDSTSNWIKLHTSEQELNYPITHYHKSKLSLFQKIKARKNKTQS